MSRTPATTTPSAVPSAPCIQAVWAVDGNYAHGAAMSIFAASRRTPADAVFTVIMQPGDMAEAEWALLRPALRPNHTLRIVVADDVRVDRCVRNAIHSSRAVYMRFLIPELLPEIDRCLYLDADVMVLDDLSNLWHEVSPVAPVSAVRDLFLTSEGKYVRSLGMKDYFNSGVLGLNLPVWRREGIAGKCLRVAAEEKPYRFLDQDVLNLTLQGRVHWLDVRWNILSDFTGIYVHDAREVSRAEWRELMAHPGAAHFTIPRKPWHGCMRHYWSWRYWEVAAQSPWRDLYAPRRAQARRAYLTYRMRHWRRWFLRVARRREGRPGFVILFGRKMELS